MPIAKHAKVTADRFKPFHGFKSLFMPVLTNATGYHLWAAYDRSIVIDEIVIRVGAAGTSQVVLTRIPNGGNPIGGATIIGSLVTLVTNTDVVLPIIEDSLGLADPRIIRRGESLGLLMGAGTDSTNAAVYIRFRDLTGGA